MRNQNGREQEKVTMTVLYDLDSVIIVHQAGSDVIPLSVPCELKVTVLCDCVCQGSCVVG